jgi:hypothetical protein
MSKVANDQEKKRQREIKVANTAASKAQRRDNHAPPRIPIGRAPGAPKRDRHADRRTFNSRTVHRKQRRVENDLRHGQSQPQGQARSVHIDHRGKGSGGGGWSGGKGGGGGGGWSAGKGKGGSKGKGGHSSGRDGRH